VSRAPHEVLFTPEQAAEQLGLHVKTVRRYIREGRLDAVRMGKRYRVTRDALEAFAGVSLRSASQPSHHPTTEVSTVLGIDSLSRDDAERLTTYLLASANGPRPADESLRVETIYYPERSRLKVIVHGDLACTMSVLALINSLLDGRS